MVHRAPFSGRRVSRCVPRDQHPARPQGASAGSEHRRPGRRAERLHDSAVARVDPLEHGRRPGAPASRGGRRTTRHPPRAPGRWRSRRSSRLDDFVAPRVDVGDRGVLLVQNPHAAVRADRGGTAYVDPRDEPASRRIDHGDLCLLPRQARRRVAASARRRRRQHGRRRLPPRPRSPPTTRPIAEPSAPCTATTPSLRRRIRAYSPVVRGAFVIAVCSGGPRRSSGRARRVRRLEPDLLPGRLADPRREVRVVPPPRRIAPFALTSAARRQGARGAASSG